MDNTYKTNNKEIKIGFVLTLSMFATVIIHVITSAGIDSDIWFILNNGRYIIHNGFPTTNPFTIHNNFPIIISQPLTSIIEYGMYVLLKEKGLYIWTIFFTFLSIFMVYKLSRNTANSLPLNFSRFISSTITIMFSVGAFCHFWSNRPQLVTISLLAMELTILEKYRQNKSKWKQIVFGLPIISFLVANIHGSFYVSVYLPILAYFAAYIIQKMFAKQNIATNMLCTSIKHVIIATCCMVAAGLINPYGVNGNLYLLNSIGIATKYNLIQELSKPILISTQTLFFIIVVTVGIFGIYNQWKNNSLNMYQIILWFGGNITYLFAIRNLWIAALFSIPLITDTVSSYNITERIWLIFQELCSKKNWHLLMCTIIILMTIYNIANWKTNWSVKDSHTTPVCAVQYLNNNVCDKENIKIYTSFNNEAYIEWYGYKTYIDARPELYEQKDNAIYSEFVSIYRSSTDPQAFLEKYNFDFLILYDDNSTSEALLRYYVHNNNDWECIVSGNGYQMFQKQS